MSKRPRPQFATLGHSECNRVAWRSSSFSASDSAASMPTQMEGMEADRKRGPHNHSHATSRSATTPTTKSRVIHVRTATGMATEACHSHMRTSSLETHGQAPQPPMLSISTMSAESGSPQALKLGQTNGSSVAPRDARKEEGEDPERSRKAFKRE
mmetsp:Transcript_14724/g.26506  ORF Transcript_14724/g.26506 Transcript_14724/m.26506 type:complete len:155 (+) Transcript_14724:182-646(+)|eukprot:CAMPEP_0197517058 /NCGR_PEP_ID=MMETSP1318-20131121/2014_1 /TAXON_ID=552666 /ORGANISM="Partenskyella glossopodia, Strain RCC365" /LENGTH=154 /DNA_ID=CAMNT_0043066297 /DNA_START=301 /DNA_END=765 /DNA_ORIENTATION=+